MEDKKAKFMRIYANIPDEIRREDIIVVIEKKPYTWDNALIEVKNNTDIGKKIIKQLEKLGVI